MTEGAMPAVFFGHGSPMNALERNRFTEASWKAGACRRLDSLNPTAWKVS